MRWYSEKLGLEVVMRPPKIEKSTAVILEGGGLIVELGPFPATAEQRANAVIRDNEGNYIQLFGAR